MNILFLDDVFPPELLKEQKKWEKEQRKQDKKALKEEKKALKQLKKEEKRKDPRGSL